MTEKERPHTQALISIIDENYCICLDCASSRGHVHHTIFFCVSAGCGCCTEASSRSAIE
jgi:hypothetical protein